MGVSYYPGTEEAHVLTRCASEGSALKPSLALRVGIWKDAELSCRGNIVCHLPNR